MRATYRVDPDPVLDITSNIDARGERGLLGLAFSPDGGELYVVLDRPAGTITLDALPHGRRRRPTPAAAGRCCGSSTPGRTTTAASSSIGPDGFLYIGIGDGGGAGDPDRNGQNPDTLLGKILRIDPDRARPTAALRHPRGQPVRRRREGAPEVWAYGLRNPWRFSFDRRTGDLWIGDVGQNELGGDRLPAGRRRPAPAGEPTSAGTCMEGNHPFQGGTAPAGARAPALRLPATTTAPAPSSGATCTAARPTRPGRACTCGPTTASGEIHILLRRPDGRVEDRNTGLRRPAGDAGSVTSFGEDDAGELYVLSATGGVYRVEEA